MRSPRIDRLDYNAIINGAYDFAQRSSGATQTLSAPQYLVHDRFYVNRQAGIAGAGDINITAQADLPPGVIAGGSARLVCNSIVTTGDPQFHVYGHRIEGVFFNRLQGKKCVYQFWAKSNVDRSLALRISLTSSVQNRRFSVPFDIESGLVWKKYQIAFDFGASGIVSPILTNNTGADIQFILSNQGNATGAQFNQWEDDAAPFYHAGMDSFMDNATNQLWFHGHLLREVTDDQYNAVLNGEEIDMEFSRTGIDPFSEFQLCQRYFEMSNDLTLGADNPSFSAGFSLSVSMTNLNSILDKQQFLVRKRADPIVTVRHPQTGTVNQVRQFGGTVYAVTTSRILETGFGLLNNSGGIIPAQQYTFYWAAEAEL